MKLSNSGFTLAEVLITLGIIGIVAAMTLPGLIGKWQKVETVTRLKRAYTVLSLAVERAKADYGDITTWELDGIRGSDYGNRKQIIENFSAMYLIPYLAKVRNAEFKRLNVFGYDKIINPDGTELSGFLRNSEQEIIVLNDGSVVLVSLDSYRSSNGNEVLSDVLFLVDLNGLKKPNIVSRDIFLMKLPIINRSKLEFAGYSVDTYETNLRRCQSGRNDGASYCGKLIMMDGWEIKDHYPW